MIFRVIIEAAAHQSLERNSLWWAENHSIEEAREWQSVIYQQLADLQTMPQRHGFARENSAFPFELRQKLVGKGKRLAYRAVFTIRNNVVHVLDVLAAEQDDWRAP